MEPSIDNKIGTFLFISGPEWLLPACHSLRLKPAPASEAGPEPEARKVGVQRHGNLAFHSYSIHLAEQSEHDEEPQPKHEPQAMSILNIIYLQ